MPRAGRPRRPGAKPERSARRVARGPRGDPALRPQAPARRRGAACRRALPRETHVASVGPPSSSSDCTPSAASSRSARRRAVRSGARAPSPPAAGRGRTRGGAAAARRATSRASRRGFSSRTVPIPTATASDAARNWCTSRRDASPETQREPGLVTRPSSVTAALYVTKGLFDVTHRRQASFWRRAAAESAWSTSRPAWRSRSSPPPASGLGSSDPATTRAMPAWRIASTHGGVVP